MSSQVHHFFKVRGGVTSTSSNNPITTNNNSVKATETVHIAVQGCCHGELDKIYAACASHEASTGKRIDFLICCGDFQALRDARDLQSIAVPAKYRTLGDFAAYYRGEKKAPYLTLFVGGNHEGSDWLAAESYGGFLAPNIYYLGHSGVVVVDGRVTLAGVSGIFKGHDFTRPYPPRPFYISEAAKRSAYHVRRIEVEKIKVFAHLLTTLQKLEEEENENENEEKNKKGEREESSTEVGPSTLTTSSSSSYSITTRCAAEFPHVDLFVSHDWPVGITKYGDEDQLLRYKPFFSDDIRHNALGNPHSMSLLRALKPNYWLAAHLHCKFEATVPHHNINNNDSTTTSKGIPQSTKFIALDKCAKGKGFLDFIDVSVPTIKKNNISRESERVIDSQSRVMHHPLWLEVLRDSHNYMAINDGRWSLEFCTLHQKPLKELKSFNLWLPANNTSSLLHSLGLPLNPLQQEETKEQQQQEQQQQQQLNNFTGITTSSGYGYDIHDMTNGNWNLRREGIKKETTIEDKIIEKRDEDVMEELVWMEDTVGA